MRRDRQVGAYMALIAAVVFWGVSFVATKVALESLPPFTLIFGRFGLGSCLFLAVLAFRGFPRFSRKDHIKVVITALFEPGLYFVFETIGLQHTTASKAALIIATVPLAVLVFAVLLLGERTNVAGLVGMATSLLGIGILVTGDQQCSWMLAGQLLGDLLIFGAVLSAALYIVWVRGLGKKYSAFEITSVQVIYGALFYVPAFLWEFPTLAWSEISTRSLEALAFLTVFATIGAFLCYNYALTKVPATRSAVFINGIPVVTVLAAWVLLGEKLSLVHAFGGILVLLGVCLTNLPGLRVVA